MDWEERLEKGKGSGEDRVHSDLSKDGGWNLHVEGWEE